MESTGEKKDRKELPVLKISEKKGMTRLILDENELTTVTNFHIHGEGSARNVLATITLRCNMEITLD